MSINTYVCIFKTAATKQGTRDQFLCMFFPIDAISKIPDSGPVIHLYLHMYMYVQITLVHSYIAVQEDKI